MNLAWFHFFSAFCSWFHIKWHKSVIPIERAKKQFFCCKQTQREEFRASRDKVPTKIGLYHVGLSLFLFLISWFTCESGMVMNSKLRRCDIKYQFQYESFWQRSSILSACKQKHVAKASFDDVGSCCLVSFMSHGCKSIPILHFFGAMNQNARAGFINRNWSVESLLGSCPGRTFLSLSVSKTEKESGNSHKEV
jgi:hypothetical protein